MGILTLDEIRTEISSALGERSEVLPDRLDVWANMAYFDVSSGIEFEELNGTISIPTVGAQREYVLTSSPMEVQFVRDDDNEELITWVSLGEFLRLSTAAAGALARWTRQGNNLLYHPTPAGVVNTTAHVRSTPTRLVADADVTVLPGFVDVAIILLGTHYGLMALGEDQRGILWLNRAINYLQSRITGLDLSKMIEGLKKSQANLEIGATDGP